MVLLVKQSYMHVRYTDQMILLVNENHIDLPISFDQSNQIFSSFWCFLRMKRNSWEISKCHLNVE